ncbi:hypothetical protein N658DRAFT_508276 [Parathielavia hyrcaniae]|uniref:RTA1 domain protein n=1 Tax=Parathielavia hyrcaniae TaxID=113614 RepID=A0AAN6PXR1_9PEZI|nr:hypothetical protein N658DRAFT_508276 [Parathielavia hyrcaniae]
MSGELVEGSVYFYAPNKGAPVFFAVAFAASGIYHGYQCNHYNSWRLTGLYVICSLLFTVGFIVREVGAFDYSDLVKFIVSTCVIYAAPPLVALANYTILGRILYYAPYHSPIHPGRVITTFAFISFVVESLNGAGAAHVANMSLPANLQEIGRSLLKAALVIQLAVLACFVLLAVTFHRRCLRAGLRNPALLAPLYTLYASTLLITARTVFRVAEYWTVAEHDFYSGDIDPDDLSPAIRYEWFFWVFEASLMLVNHVLFNVRHPRRYLPKSVKVYLSPADGATEIMGPGYKDGRPVWVTVLDPFDLVGLVKGRDESKARKFWEGDSEGGKKEGSRVGEGQV